MPGVSKEQVEMARVVDLLTYLQISEPRELRRSGPNEYRTISISSTASPGLGFSTRITPVPDIPRPAPITSARKPPRCTPAGPRGAVCSCMSF